MPLVVLAVFGTVMVLFPITVTAWLLPVEKEKVKVEALDSSKIEYLASSLSGLYFLAWAITDGFYVWGIFLAIRHMGMQWSWTPEYAGTAMAALAEFCIALWFLFGAKGLWAMVRWARKIGTQK